VQPALAAGTPLEVLDRVGQVDLLALDLGALERPREDAAGRPDEGLALDVLAVAGLLADQHQLRLAQAGAEDRLGRVSPERAAAALGGGPAQLAQRAALGDELRGG
jgi:hypothetical protein